MYKVWLAGFGCLALLLAGCATGPEKEATANATPPAMVEKQPVSEKTQVKKAPAVTDLVFLPQPRSVTPEQGTVDAGQTPKMMVDAAKMPHPQGYLLVLSAKDGVQITAHDDIGAFYAQQTLKQLTRQYPNNAALPALRIEDWPDFLQRGVMLDVARDKVPTMETLFMLADMFAEMKFNQIQLYTEHTFAYKGHELVWKDASPMTGEEIRTLDAYCKQRFIELVPNQNSFGHMERWLSHPEYQYLAEKQGSSDLCPVDPSSIAFLKGLYDDLLPNFSSNKVNVGCDETMSLGKGRSKEEAQRIGEGQVYLNFLKQIQQLVQAHGKTMQFWGDIIMQYPDLIPEIPANVVAMEWGYEANHPFAEHGQKFAASKIPFCVVPGTSTWNSLLGRTDNALENLRNAAKNGFANGAEGFLVTDWGDSGHWQFIPVSFAPFAYGAAVSWCYETNNALPLAKALNTHVFQDEAGMMGQAVLDLGNAHTKTGVSIGNSTVYYALLLNAVQGSPQKGMLKNLTLAGADDAISALDDGLARIKASKMARPDAQRIVDEFSTDVALARFSLVLGKERIANGNVGTVQLPAKLRDAMAKQLTEIIAEYKRLWLERNRPGGLTESAGRMESLRERLEEKTNPAK